MLFRSSLQMSLELVSHELFETIQFPFNLVTREPADDLIGRARRNGLGFIVMKPLCGGQYDDAELAFRFLNEWPDLLPIPGIETAAEIEQIVEVVASGRTLEGESLRRAHEVAERLGKLFCRRCGYCLPCPQGIEVNMAMVWDSFVQRFPRERLLAGPAHVVAKAAECIRCGACESRCPYNLSIMDTIAANAKAAVAALAQK